MLIKSLYIKNFRQFKGEKEIQFACDKDRNVTIILGDNTFGKTTLLQSFNWCLYNFVLFDKDSRPDFLLNHEIANQIQPGEVQTVIVEITLIHNNIEYNIRRYQNYKMSQNNVIGEPSAISMAYKNSDGQTEIRNQYIEKTINQILPKELSDYFFFDTERVRDVSNRQDVTEAVKGLLGLTALDNTMKHLGSKNKITSVLGKLYSSMDNDGNSKAKDALEKIHNIHDKKNLIHNQLENLKNQILDYEQEKERLEIILKDNYNTKTFQERIIQLERLIKSESESLENSYNLFIQDFNKGSLFYFSKPLMTRASDFLKEANIDDKGIKDMTNQSIYDILERKVCICGASLEEGTECHSKILELLQYLPPESIGTSIRNFKEKIEIYDSNNQDYINNFKSRYEDILKYKNRIQEYIDEIEMNNEKIAGKDDMKTISDKLIYTKNKIKELNQKKEALIREDEKCKNDIENYQKVYEKLSIASSKNKTILLNISYAEEILNWITTTYKEKEYDIREKLEEKVNNIFKRIYHGKRIVKISSKYQVSLITLVGDKEIITGESEGLNRVKNFAFIAGLVELAKEKISTNAGEQTLNLSSEPYPLVMDAPFSNADATHTTNISKVLPEIAEQVIMFVMEKDWKYAEPVMSYRVGMKYYLNKKSDTFTILERSEY